MEGIANGLKRTILDNSIGQKASLTAFYPDDCRYNTPVLKYNLYEGPREGLKWSLDWQQASYIYHHHKTEVIVKDNPQLFSLGPMINWYYSLSLFDSPEQFRELLMDMLEVGLYGKIHRPP
ncbi:hypothetical protein D7151_06260 [Vibrio cholerae]|nr:hypothetical protein [Vibrio cholerae]